MYTPKPKCTAVDYINFIIASPKLFSCVEAAKVQPEARDSPAHDAFTRLLLRLEPDPETLWQEARPLVHRAGGVLVIDDSTLDKPYAKSIDLVTRHWSGKHHAVVRGINLTTLLWTDGDRHVPCDYRLYDKDKDGPRTTTSPPCFARLSSGASPRTASPSTAGTAAWRTSS